MSGVRPEELAAIAMREWLLLGMPAKVAEVNALRFATLKSPWAGPFTIPVGGTLGICITPNSDTFVAVTLTSGSRTATQLAADINGTSGLSGVASTDTEGRLLLTSLLAPTTSAPSKLALRGGATDVNAVLGFTKGGERRLTTALIAPGNNDIIDGWPLLSDLINRGPGTVVVILGDKLSTPDPNPRKDEHAVSMDVSVMRIEPAQQIHRNREHIYAAVRCVRELMMSNAGMQLGRASVGDIMLARPGKARIVAKPLSFGTKDNPNPLFDAAVFNADIRVFERPAA